MARKYLTQLVPPAALNDWLPRFCDSLSLARAQIVIDQLRGPLRRGTPEQIVIVTVSDSETTDDPAAAAIAIQPRNASCGHLSVDSATLVHAGPLRQFDDESLVTLGQQLAKRMDHELQARGVQFLQWATDDDATEANASVSQYCQAMGFRWLANLDYLSGPIPLNLPNANDATASRLRAVPLDWNRTDEQAAFANLVEQTYMETQDCPMLTQYRNASQTLQSYRVASCFSPNQWFQLVDRQRSQPVGCLILAQHGNESPAQQDVSEIVYMGLIPRARQQGLGMEIMRIASEVAQHSGCSRIILAVDQENHAAQWLYQRVGLQSVLREAVWIKSLAPVDA